MRIRTKQKGTAFRNDLHEFTDKWTDVPDEEVRGEYLTHENLEVEEKKIDKATTGAET